MCFFFLVLFFLLHRSSRCRSTERSSDTTRSGRSGGERCEECRRDGRRRRSIQRRVYLGGRAGIQHGQVAGHEHRRYS